MAGPTSFFGSTIASADLGWLRASLDCYEPREIFDHRHRGHCFFVLLSGQHVDGSDWCQVEQPLASAIVRPPDFRHRTLIGPLGMAGLNISVEDPGGSDVFQSYRVAQNHAVRQASLRLAVALRRDCGIDDAATEFLAAVAGPLHDTPGWITRALERIDAEFDQAQSLTELAAEAGVHPVTFCRAFRRATSVTTSEYVAALRSAKVCDAVMRRSPVGVACVESGFTDHAHGTRWFRRLTGAPPTALSTG